MTALRLEERYNKWIFYGVLVVFLLSPVFNVKFLIHDNLDSNVVWYRNLAKSGQMFGGRDAVISNIMLGIPRDCYPSEWAIDRLFYLLLSPQAAYSLNYFLIHLLALLGMRAFLRQYVCSDNPIVSDLVGLAYAMLPFWPSGGITVAGMPLICLALFNIFKKTDKWYHWMTVILFPFYSSLFFGNMFSFPMLFLVFAIGAFRKNWKFGFKGVLAFMLLFGLSIWVEHRIIHLFMDGFQSNRIADVQEADKFMNIKGIIGTSVRAFFLGHYHFHSLQLLVAIFSLGCLFFLLLKKQAMQYTKWVLVIMTVLFASSALMIFLDNYDLRSLFGNNYKRLALRLWVYFPMLWYVIFGLILMAISTTKLKILVKPVLFIQVFFVMFLVYPYDYFGSRYAENVFANSLIYPKNPEQETFETYYMTKEIGQLKDRNPAVMIGPVATIGFSAEILQYNDLKTIEGYYSFYPLEKREMIKSIDRAERQKTTKNLDYHTNRNYLYVNNPETNELPDWNFEKMKSFGVHYLFSDFNIHKGEEKLERVDSSGPLFLYKIK